MYILKNATKNLFRNKKRNLLLLLTTSLILIATVISLTINNVSKIIIDQAYIDIASRVDISIDLFSLGGADNLVNLPLQSYIDFANAPQLTTSNIMATMPAYSPSTFAIGDDSFGTTPAPDENMAHMMTMQLLGISDTANLPDFETERFISEGRMPNAVNEVIISMDLAIHNDLYVGDVIYLESANFPVRAFELEIVGVYEDYTPAFTEWWLEMFGMFYQSRRNEIITIFDTFIAAGFDTDAGMDMQSTYYLENPAYLADFENYVREAGLPDVFSVSINTDAIEKVTGPMSSLGGLSLVFTYITLSLGLIILLLLSYLSIQERRQEIGTLRAMGMKKLNIASGLFLEVFLITAVCLGIGLTGGQLLAQPIADNLLHNEIMHSEPAETGAGGNGQVLFAGGQMQTNNAAAGFEPISEIPLSITADVITMIVFISLLLALSSTLLSIISLTKQKPIALLS